MKKTIICSALAILGIKAYAQVEDISVTVSPTASYNWFDDNAAIKDGLMVGGRVGFGFGEFFELRGTYEKTVDAKSTLDNLDLSEELTKIKNDLDLQSRKVEVERWGGEMKANIPSGGYLAPYITLGTGVQSLKAEGLEKDQQIYVSAGLGAKINLNDRIVLNLEGKNTAFNLNKSNVLYNASGASDKTFSDKFKTFIGDSKDERMYNWSVLAGLQFYLGGRESGTLSELDRAYLRKFSGGLSGLKLVLEPGGAYVDFNKDLPYSDTYLVGGSVGMDFSQYVGLRAFYYQATKDEKFKKFDDLSMYGGELFARLNVARGISPYLTVGGGYLNVYEDSYQAKQGALSKPEDSYFVKGGLGVNVPVSKYFELFGAANLLYTTTKKAENLQNIQNPSELKQSKMYNVGLRFNLGASANEDDALQNAIENANGTTQYKERIKELEKELQQAYKENDSDKAVRVIKEKQELENTSNADANVRLTPAELQDLVEKTIDEVNSGYEKKTSENKEESVDQRIQRLENLLLQVNRGEYSNYQGSNGNVQANATQQILNELKELNAKVDSNSQKLSAISNADDTTVVVAPEGTQVTPENQVPVSQNNNVETSNQQVPTVAKTKEGETGIVKSLFINKGLSVDAGAVIGSAVAPVVGLRGHYGFTNSKFELQPSIYFGLGSKGAFGLNANAVYKFDIERGPIVHPYLGAGIGYNKLDGSSKFGANLVVGTSFDILDGKLYVDYSALDLAKYNKISVGYKFGF